jgi:hypothetical protein
MTCNLSTADRALRALVGIVVLAAGVAAGRWWGLLGLIPLGNALVGWCGLYQALGISTARKTP